MKKMIVLLAVASAILMSSLAMADGGEATTCADNPWQFGCPLWHPPGR